ncbi:MAG TPA: isoprenylcysteine carboxylmethyltransferase family protein [Chitinophagales bacterium]|nr:isoprenylcysteine carboxylmethyltransferase family protein [Chitinophagales bacterium]
MRILLKRVQRYQLAGRALGFIKWVKCSIVAGYMAALKAQDYLFVGIQLIIGAVYGFCAFFVQHPQTWPFNQAGWLLIISGILFTGWAVWQIRHHITMFPTPKDHAQLITTGAFARVRHPIYSGILLIAFGGAWLAGSWVMMGLGVMLNALFYVKSNYEEKRLSAFFPEYPVYMQETGKFFPKLK